MHQTYVRATVSAEYFQGAGVHPKMIQVHGAPATIIMGVGKGGGWGRGWVGQELTHFF